MKLNILIKSKIKRRSKKFNKEKGIKNENPI